MVIVRILPYCQPGCATKERKVYALEGSMSLISMLKREMDAPSADSYFATREKPCGNEEVSIIDWQDTRKKDNIS